MPWPISLTGLWDALDVVANLDVFNAISFDCISSGITFYDTFLITIIYPVVVLALGAVITFIRMQLSSDEPQEIMNWAHKLVLGFLLVIYPSVSNTILQVPSLDPKTSPADLNLIAADASRYFQTLGVALSHH